VKALGALKLSKAQLLDLPTLASILKFHVVPGKVLSSSLSNGLEATTLEGGKLKFDLSNGVKVNGANVIKADIVVDNGVIHVIDGVLLPPPKVADYIAAMPGISAPFGFFDPAGFTADQSIAEVKRLREAEIIHGRVAMLATVGFLVGEAVHPLFNGEITGLAINQFQQVPAGFEAAVTLAVGIAEAGRASKGWVEPGNGLFLLRDSYTPGDLGFDPLGLKPTNAAELKDISTKEINNGRLAMLAIAGFVMQEEIFQKTIAEQMAN
jgi:light-harvesting complex I chlorophyll a/b binding protein 1